MKAIGGETKSCWRPYSVREVGVFVGTNILFQWSGALDHSLGLPVEVAWAQGRRVEYSIGWPADERTWAALAKAREAHWTPGLTAAADADEQAQVLELTCWWPAGVRIIARRVPRSVGEQAELGADPNWRYGAFVTDAATGQVQRLDARHRTQAHVEPTSRS